MTPEMETSQEGHGASVSDQPDKVKSCEVKNSSSFWLSLQQREGLRGGEQRGSAPGSDASQRHVPSQTLH